MHRVALVGVVPRNRLVFNELYGRLLVFLLVVVDSVFTLLAADSYYEWCAYPGAMTTLMLDCVNWRRLVVSSVLKTQLNTGSPSSEMLQFRAY
jgi:hypothetical protein